MSENPVKIRVDGTVTLGQIIVGLPILIGAVTAYAMQARTDERQDGAIESAQSRVERLEASGARADNAIAQIQQTLARIDGRMEGVVQGQQRLERALEVRQ